MRHLLWVKDFTMLIRVMQPNDINQVVAIEQSTQFHPWTAAQFLDSLKSYQCTVLEQNQQVIGFCIMQPVLDEANLLLMAVAPKYQGHGFGFGLLSDALQRLGEQCVQVFLEVRESNHAAIALYEKAGFHQIDIRKNYYPAPKQQRENAIIMVNSLRLDSFDFSV